MTQQPSMSQLAPLPHDLPFKVISRTIGTGAYAFIRKAVPRNATAPVVAVKFIHKEHAFKLGNLKPHQLKNEVTLHKHLTFEKQHKHIISFFAANEDPSFIWIAMELAEGGDLFDKIEADVGVGVDIAHVYFTQLINAVGFAHSKGVAHRDIKPENVLLSQNGDLKLADFGLATLFKYKDKVKKNTSIVGSPPYMAPDPIACHKSGTGYDAELTDIWSCGIVLFVLLVGNTPWDEPTAKSFEFKEFIRAGGRPPVGDDLWERIPPDALSLVLGMLVVQPEHRFSLDTIKQHPWFTRRNPWLSPSGSVADPVRLATQMMQNLRVDFDAPPSQSRASQSQSHAQDAMEVEPQLPSLPLPLYSSADPNRPLPFIPATQPEHPLAEDPYDWEHARPSIISATQPQQQGAGSLLRGRSVSNQQQIASERQALIENDISLSQFSRNPQVPLTLTQMARKFNDIAPSWSINKFVVAAATTPLPQLVEHVRDALGRCSVSVKASGDLSRLEADSAAVALHIWTHRPRMCPLMGSVVICRCGFEHYEVRFVKATGDPVEWRRLFKDVAVLCKDLIIGRE